MTLGSERPNLQEHHGHQPHQLGQKVHPHPEREGERRVRNHLSNEYYTIHIITGVFDQYGNSYLHAVGTSWARRTNGTRQALSGRRE